MTNTYKYDDVEEIKRLQTLLSYNILDTPYEEEFDSLVKLISLVCNSPIAVISMIDDQRQWYKAKTGIDQDEAPISETFCQYALQQEDILEIQDATKDERVKNNSQVLAEDGIRFYAGVNLKADNGYKIGTVCVVDTKPKKLTPEQKQALRLIADQTMSLLEARKKNRELGEELKEIIDHKAQEAQKQLLQKKIEYNVLLRAIKKSNAVVEFSPEGIIKSVNDNFLNIMGYSRVEVIGQNHDFFLDEDQQEKNIEFWSSLRKGKFYSGRFIRKHKDGSSVWIRATYNPITNHQHEVIRVIKIAQDITTEIEAEKALQRAKEAAESLNNQKDSFIANVSHEIRTPIHAVLGFTELLLEQEQDRQKLSYLKSVKTAGDNLMFIINDILDLSKINAGNIQMHASNFRVKQVVQNVFSILHLKAKQKQLKLLYNISPEVPEFLLGDSNRLSQVLLNLLGNALKFTMEGRVELEIGLEGMQDDKFLVRFQVSDTGIGIAEDKLERIFQRFSQADESISRKFGGTGLGLNISRQLVEWQNGSMNVKSREGEGSKFSFIIPYPAGDDLEVLEPVDIKEEGISTTGKILLCEDNELNQRLIEAILTEKKYTVDVAGDGLTAIDLFRQNSYDLVLMDLQMPRQDGRETTRRIRKELNSKVPVIALTANFMNIEREKCLQDGMNDYLSKPFNKTDLFDMINKWISRHRQSNPSARRLEQKKSLISLEHLEQMSAGNREFQQEMINLFLENSEKSMDQMQNHLKERELEELRAVAHKLKGSFGVIGADLTLLQKLEDAGDTQETEQYLLALKEQLSEIFAILKK